MRKSVAGIITTVFLIFQSLYTNGQSNVKDSAVLLLRQLEKSYEDGNMSRRLYLDTVHSTVRSLISIDVNFTNKELLGLMEKYRQIIWNNDEFEDEKRVYYGLLSNQAQMTGRSGEMLYYADKFNDLEKAGSDKPSITALTIQAGYYNTNNSYALTQELYNNYKSFILEDILTQVRKEETTMPQAVQSTIVLAHLGEALFAMKDTVNGNKILNLMDEAVDIIKSRFPDNDRANSHALYGRYCLIYYKADALESSALARESFSLLEQLLQTDKTPEYLKNYISFFLTEKKLAFFIREKNVDSTAVYLKAFDKEYKKETLVYNAYITKKFKALALYNEGHYRESADSLQVAMKLLDSARTIATREIDEMMYAQARSEEQEVLLRDAEIAARKKENTIRIILAGAILLLASGAYFIWRQRQRQRKKLLEFKLNMARNIHDETGPALLYAKSLAKSYRTKGYSEETTLEVEKQLDNTIAVIRGLSHDLKSPVLHSVSQLIREMDGVLKKLKDVNVFSYEIEKKIKDDRFISHYQYSNLRSILHEGVTNSIKHSEFDKIRIGFKLENNRLLITYSDNGKGWEERRGKNGIGLENIAERVKQMNGDYLVRNEFPEGYEISINVLLR